MKDELFSQSVIDEYLEKIRRASTLELLHDYFAKSKEWLDWLLSHGSITQRSYKQLKRQLVLHVESRSKQLQNSPKIKVEMKGVFFVILMIIISLVFYFVFFLIDWPRIFQVSEDTFSNQPSDKRVLPFRGILKNAEGTAIDTKQDVYFALYNSQFEGTPLFTGFCVGEGGITPEYNGSFTVTLGTDCGMKPISKSLFDENKALYLGVRIGNDNEIQPRYKISTSGYSQDTALLGGLPAGKMNSSIPYIDERGAIVIDSETPSIQSTDGIFKIEGKSLSIQTLEDGGGDIMFQPGIGGNSIVTSGNFGIGDLIPPTRLSVVGVEPYSAIATFKNIALIDEDQTSVLNLGLATDINGSNATYVNFYANATKDTTGELVGSIRLNKNHVVYETSGADIAEYFSVKEDRSFKPGMVMTLSSNGIHAGMKGEPVIGVVTDTAGYIGNVTRDKNNILIGLIGQIEVFVSDINGAIRAGDRVGLSLIPGYGAKAISDPETVGYFLEDMNVDALIFSNNFCPIEYKNVVTISGSLVRCGRLHILLRPK
ncbi:hypothetical protein COY16_04380 [Candidatus Roizmanbacteria bacterium CG_4_10_14_0_2_um_filter_39_13]|uniref:Peptidase G2 IMC autoproteolytic cleavage domain-containing protein n=1 Tax=Candidatus Roizmanbacteria bacterium CG_4_10_14_0_2_um_filter_39_13 TaxID=1974825 RepID=A0A2M7TXE3_9BACT|nr:MAG: hypothetical protein COY16_04380 [Candidatus Roizmanbacteria bacterium CG_4_10_14_0_2_um_filter_39_13]